MPPATLIDRHVLEQYCAHEASILREILTVFNDTFSQDVEQLHQAILSQNSEETRFLLHRMKGTLQVFGAHTTLENMDRLRQHVIAGEFPSEVPQDLFTQLNLIIKQVHQIHVPD